MSEHTFHIRRDAGVCFVLCVLVAAVFGQTLRFEFLDFDDNVHVTENALVRQGVTLHGLAAIFTGPKTGLWHPVTWLSHMLDCQSYGLNPAGHHLRNVLFHAANTVLLYLFLVRATGMSWRSAWAAAIFAIHPLHVEPVAWISSRKDVLSGFFALLTMLAYVRYAKRPGFWQYGLVALLLALGLMSKPMLMTLPFALLLLDVWPLQRIQTPNGQWTPDVRVYSKLVVEKLPLIALSIATGVISVLEAKQGGSYRTFDEVPLAARLTSVPIHYVKYMFMTLWPANLAAPYPQLGKVAPGPQVFGALLVLLVITALLFRAIHARPYLLVGWLWFLGMLLPVIGFVPVGVQSMADRYMYLPIIGLIVMAAWGLPELACGNRVALRTLGVAVIVVVLALTAAAWQQTRTWRSTETVFTRTIDVMPDNPPALANLGELLRKRGDYEGALRRIDSALLASPTYVQAYVNKGATLIESGRPAEAIPALQTAIELQPNSADAHNNLGNALVALQRLDEAMAEYTRALQIDPHHANAINGKGAVLMMQGKAQDAVNHYSEAVAALPDDAVLHHNLSVALSALGQKEEAVRHSEEAIRLDPHYETARQFLAHLQALP